MTFAVIITPRIRRLQLLSPLIHNLSARVLTDLNHAEVFYCLFVFHCQNDVRWCAMKFKPCSAVRPSWVHIRTVPGWPTVNLVSHAHPVYFHWHKWPLPSAHGCVSQIQGQLLTLQKSPGRHFSCSLTSYCNGIIFSLQLQWPRPCIL